MNMNVNVNAEETVIEEEQSLDSGESEDVQAEETDWEEEASYQGWVPQDEFRGPKNAWLPAEQFVRKGREINPILRANNERLKQSIQLLENQNRIYSEELRQLREAQRSINTRDFDTTIAEKNRQRMAAMKAGDEDLFLQLDSDIAKLLLSKGELIDGSDSHSPQGRTSDKPQVNVDPVFDQWVSENNWYGQDEVRTVLVNKVAEQMRDEYPNLHGRKFLDGALRRAKQRYPEDFGVSYSSNRHSVGDTSDPSVMVRQGKGKTERDLPHDAKVAMQAFVAEKLGTKEDYLRIYFED